jgi:hypothetical protein
MRHASWQKHHPMRMSRTRSENRAAAATTDAKNADPAAAGADPAG